MDAARSERARHRLRNGPQAGLGGRERGEFGTTARRGRGAGEDDGSLAVLDHLLRGCLAHHEAGAAAQPPDLLEHGRVDFQKGLPVLRSGIENGNVQAPQPRDLVEHGMDLVVETKVRCPDHRLAALRRDFGRDAQ